jgi:hypothetical protein
MSQRASTTAGCTATYKLRASRGIGQYHDISVVYGGVLKFRPVPAPLFSGNPLKN